MCFARAEIIALLNKIKPPYNINIVSQQIALEELHFEVRKNRWVSEIITEREKLRQGLAKIDSVQEIYPSDANFLLVKITNARSVYETLIKKGIVVRDRSNVILCEDCLRITIGTQQENQILLNELKQV